jgi:hypothetical protein
MEKAILLFNGIKLPFALTDRAFSWARQSKAEVVAVFLRAKNDSAEGYVFPSDLDAAENLTTTDEAGASHEQLIDSNVRIIENQAARENIVLHSTILEDPEAGQLDELAAGSSRIFVHESITKPATLTTAQVDLEKWLKKVTVPVEIVPG